MSLTGSASRPNELQGSVESGGEVRGKLSGLEFIQGKSAYEVAVINGFSGTEEEWLASLKGKQGPAGPKGDTGAKGDKGAQGDKGDKGDPGEKGEQGEVGPAGPQGASGEKGEKGDKGDTGPQGQTGPEGPQGPKGDTGATGPQGEKGETGSGFKVLDYYASLSALQSAVPSPNVGDAYGVGTADPYDIYIYGKTSGWVNNGPLQGAKGDTGPQGPKGDTGAQGPQGEKGETGPAGADGTDGIFYAQFGVDTFAEIKEAYASGKAVYAVKDGSVYTMSDMFDTFAVFTYMTSTGAGHQELRMITYVGDDSTGTYASDSNKFLTDADVTAKIPTYVSSFINDSGYIKSMDTPSGDLGHYFYAPTVLQARVNDTRFENPTPAELPQNIIKYEFKAQSIIGLPGEAAPFATIFSIKQWGDPSGGVPMRIAFTQDGAIYMQMSNADFTAWQDWKRITLSDAEKAAWNAKLSAENPASTGVFTHDGKGAGNTDVILQIRSNNGMLTGYGDVSSAFHFGSVPVYFDTLVFFGQGFSFPTPGGTLTGNFTQLKGFSNSEFRAGTTNYVETGCNYGAYPTAEKQNFIVKNIDPAGGTGDNWSYQAFNQAADGTWERVFGVKADGTIVSKGEEITPGGGFSGGYVDGSISPNSDALNLGELGKAWYQLFAKIVYFFDASAANSQYAFGMYQWGDNYTFVVRDAATNGYIADLWQINGATRVTNFNVKPTVAGKELVTTDDLNAAIANAIGNVDTLLGTGEVTV